MVIYWQVDVTGLGRAGRATRNPSTGRQRTCYQMRAAVVNWIREYWQGGLIETSPRPCLTRKSRLETQNRAGYFQSDLQAMSDKASTYREGCCYRLEIFLNCWVNYLYNIQWLPTIIIWYLSLSKGSFDDYCLVPSWSPPVKTTCIGTWLQMAASKSGYWICLSKHRLQVWTGWVFN